jgi:formyltetrahydrofolate deformylase
MNNYILKVSCKDRSGIVAKISDFLYKNQGFIIESSQFGDEYTGNFFLRAEFTCPEPLEELKERFNSVAEELELKYDFHDKSYKPKVILAVSKASHCLQHILHKVETGALPIEVAGVMSNHEKLKNVAERFGTKYYHLPITDGDKKAQESEIERLFSSLESDLLVLARYMQILSDKFCQKFQEKVINIHHSFLPGFKGAKPYHQAFDRGVKLIGATAHYATSDLDEGPIIEQEVLRVDHSFKPEDLKQAGEDVENRALFQAIKNHIEHRVIVNGNKTVIL